MSPRDEDSSFRVQKECQSSEKTWHVSQKEGGTLLDPRDCNRDIRFNATCFIHCTLSMLSSDENII